MLITPDGEEYILDNTAYKNHSKLEVMHFAEIPKFPKAVNLSREIIEEPYIISIKYDGKGYRTMIGEWNGETWVVQDFKSVDELYLEDIDKLRILCPCF